MLRILNSKIDESTNFIKNNLAGFIESRYVRKCDKYFIAYLSSQNNCNKGCVFCHLTYTNQTVSKDLSITQFTSQADQIFEHYKKDKIRPKAQYMHYNFMARGEPLANKILLESGDELLSKLGQIAKGEGLPAKFNISTIMPVTLKQPLTDVFNYISPTIYYSLYSTNSDWRKKWMPAAMDTDLALRLLKDYQQFSKKIIKIHFPFIDGENDSIEDVNSVCDDLDKVGLICEFNLVRYNPASPDQGVESSEGVIERNIKLLQERFRFSGKVQIIPRVGMDVYASCGMFIQ